MRRREKFVLATILLSFGFFLIQQVPLDWRYWAIGLFGLISYAVASWALADDLQFYERITIVPMNPLYSVSVALFYFLLPSSLVGQIILLSLFGIGQYALFLTSNIYSVAKGRTIQLLYAASAIGFILSLVISLFLTNTIFSLKFPFWANGLLLILTHFPLIFMSLWAVNLEEFIAKDILIYSSLTSLFLGEFATIISLIPMPIWNSSLFIMGLVYLSLGILQSYLRGRLFKNTITEYSLMAGLLAILFLVFFPFK